MSITPSPRISCRITPKQREYLDTLGQGLQVLLIQALLHNTLEELKVNPTYAHDIMGAYDRLPEEEK